MRDYPFVGRLVAATLSARLCSYDFSTELADLHVGTPILCVANHVCSLDSWIAYDVTVRHLHRGFLHVGEDSVLKRHPYLTRFGVFAVSGSDPMLTMRSLSAIGRELRTTDRDQAAWVFPTGSHEASMDFEREVHAGVQALARVSGDARVVPVGLHYYVYRRPRASIWVHVGQPIGLASEVSRERWDSAAGRIRAGIKESLATAAQQIRERTQAKLAAPSQPVILDSYLSGEREKMEIDR
jgi:hypothetical protein